MPTCSTSRTSATSDGSPPAGQSVLQAAGTRLLAFYNALAPAVTSRNPSWLLLFQDCTGGYNIANPIES